MKRTYPKTREQASKSAKEKTCVQKRQSHAKELCLFPPDEPKAAIVLLEASAAGVREQVAKKEQLERTFRIELGKLFARWERLVPLFEDLERLSVCPETGIKDRPETPFLHFERNGVG